MMSAVKDSPLARISAVLDHYKSSLLQSNIHPAPESSVPLFDPLVLHSGLQQPHLRQEDISLHASSWGLPEALQSEISSLLLNESARYRAVVERTRQEMLGRLIKTSVSPDPTLLPAMVEAACGAIYQSNINGILHEIQEQVQTYSAHDLAESDDDEGSESEQESDSSESNDDNEDEDDMDVEDDENTPMKPGEEVPPLDTKYLPIFEALHERGKVLTKPEKTYLVEMTGMTYRQITIWFQNRRRGELKEDMHARASSSHAPSVHSDQSSEVSDDELDLERRVATTPLDTSFNIRSWCLASAAATKNDAHMPPLPPSPIKSGFGSIDMVPSFVSDDSDLTDSDDDDAPPGLRVPSLAMSVTTIDSGSDRGPKTGSSDSSRIALGSLQAPVIVNEDTAATASLEFARPIKSLPSSRRGSPPAPLPSSQPQPAPAFSFNFTGATPTPTEKQFSPPSAPAPSQYVTSNERGLTLQMDSTPPSSTTTLQAPAPGPPISANFTAPTTAPTATPLSPAMSSGSRHSTPSPSSSGPSATSPRPAVKPLPRRTGCAPRPRPPPRAGSVSTAATPGSAPISARPSVVLPPTSNPSLASTTLGALLRPNPPAPKIPTEMEERLSAMAGRMGVGSGPSSVRKSVSLDASAMPRAGGAPANAPRGPSFSFSSATLPGSNSTLASISEQPSPS